MDLHGGRRKFLREASMLLAGWGPMVSRAEGRPERQRVIVAVAGQTSLQYLPLTIARRLGYFTAAGIDIELLDLANGMRAQRAVLEGAADVACGGFDDLLALHEGRHQMQTFVQLARAPQVAFGVSHRTLPGYRRVGDLQGRRIAVMASGSAADLLVAVVLARSGLALRDVRLSEAPGVGSALQAVREGQVDAMVHMEPVMTMLEQKGDVRIISDARTLKGAQEAFGGPMPATCMFAPAAYLRSYPNTVQAVTDAIVHALKWLQTAGPSDLIKALPEPYLLGDRGLYLAAFGKVRESISPDGVMPEEAVRTALRALAVRDANFKPPRGEIERMVANDFARKAKERFRA